MKRILKKLSAIAIFSLIVSLTSCDPGFHDVYIMKNELLKEVKVVFSLNGVKDTTSIGPDVDRIVMVKDGMGHSNFSFNDEYIYDMPVIIFDEDVIYKVDTTTDWDLIKCFEKTMFKKSCWEILSTVDKKGYEEYEVLYRITEEDYHNALILSGNK
ncbi:MAG: hypothetical protein J6Q39_08710 [Bacteroidales bacterium]|nr:hypothetical protein [Bacteroidales bacterium]